MRSRLGTGPGRELVEMEDKGWQAGAGTWRFSCLDSAVWAQVGAKTRKAGEILGWQVTGLGSPTGEESMDLGPLAQEGLGSDCPQFPDWRQGKC